MSSFKEPIVRLKGTNINLCVFRTDDEAIEKYLKWMNDEEILPWINRNSKICQITDEENYARKEVPENIYRFNIVTKSGELIGNCDIKVNHTKHDGCLGICIGENAGRNKGYGTEAIKMLIDYSFNQLNLHKIWLTLSAENPRALKCYEKAGMEKIGVMKEDTFSNGHWVDTIYMEIINRN